MLKNIINDSEYLLKFLNGNFKELELLGKSENDIDRSLAYLDDNYFLRYEGIPDMVVYPEGAVEFEAARMELVKAPSNIKINKIE